MRRILLNTRNGIAALTSVAKRSTLVAFAAGLMASAGTSSAVRAQYPTLYPSQYGTPGVTLASGTSGGLNSPAVMTLGDVGQSPLTTSSVVDSVFHDSKSKGQVQSASYLGNMGSQALYSAECGGSGYGPNASCNISWYFGYDALWLRREGGRRFSLTNGVFMNNPDYEFGGRYTVGKMCDCVNAYEFVYAGPFRWNRSSTVVDPGNVNSRFLTTPSSLSAAFNGADSHVQRYQSDLDSFELNRRWWAWDAVSTMVGLRYARYEDKYSLDSVRSSAPLTGSYRDHIVNNMVGLQIGGDLFMPTSLRTMLSFKGKAGVFGNFTSRDVTLQEDASILLRNGNDKVDWAGLIEVGINGSYQVTPSIRLNAGYEAWLVPGVATVSRQLPYYTTTNSGSTTRISDDIVFHGFSVGAQVLY